MILVAGGTGHLGTVLVHLLTAHGFKVRVLTRQPAHARGLLGDVAEVVGGDVREPGSLESALTSVDVVISATTGFGPRGLGPRAVDYEGNLNLIRAAEAATVDRFVLLSMRGAAPDHPMQLMRMKYGAEEALRASRLEWTIVRPTVFMELWTAIVGDPIAKTGRTTVLGRGDNPVNFVSVQDVARFVALAVVEPGLRRQALDVGGPENLTFNQLVRQVEAASGKTASVRHVPVPLMRGAATVLRPLKPDLAGIIEAGIVTDTLDMSFSAAPLRARFPQVELTRLADVVQRDFAANRANNAHARRREMFRKIVELELECSPEQAFTHVAREFFTNHPRWDPDIIELTKTSAGPIGQGTTGREVRKVGVQRLITEFDITDFEPNTLFAYRSAPGPMTEAVSFEIRPGKRGTHLKMDLEITPQALSMRLLAPLMRVLVSRKFKANMARFEAIMRRLPALSAAGIPFLDETG